MKYEHGLEDTRNMVDSGMFCGHASLHIGSLRHHCDSYLVDGVCYQGHTMSAQLCDVVTTQWR